MADENETEVEETQDTGQEVAEVEEQQETPPEKKHEPPVDSTRWNEVYGKMKTFERQVAEKEEILNAVIEHNKSLQEAVDGLYDKISITERPDQITDPEGYDKWIIEQTKRELKKAEPKKAPEVKKTTPKVQEQAEIMKSMFPDFSQVITFANEFVNKDPIKKSEIAFSDNPPRALYEYGLKKKAELMNERKTKLKQGHVEGGGGHPPGDKAITLTPEQEKARRGLGVSVEAYKKQLKIIEKGRG